MNKHLADSLYAFESKLKLARTIANLNKALTDQFKSLGISTFSLTYYFYYTNSLNKLQYDFASERFKPWHEHYLAEHYEEVDTTLAHVTQSALPVYFETANQLKQAASRREKQMREDTLKFGAVKGLCIPIHGPQGDFANLVVVQMKEESCLNKWEKIQYELLIIAYYYFSYLKKLLLKQQSPSIKHQLNKREMQCLTLLAQQLSLSLIAKKLNLTERTVNYYIQRINKKLGTKNKYQSVTKALQLGLIKT